MGLISLVCSLEGGVLIGEIRSMVQLKTNVRVRAEGSGVTAKSVITLLVLLFDTTRHDKQGRLALLAFALGQLAYSLTCVAVYLAYFGAKPLKPQVDM